MELITIVTPGGSALDSCMVVDPRVWAMNVALLGALACGPRPGEDTGSPGTSSDGTGSSGTSGDGETGAPTSGGTSASTGTDSDTGTCEPGSGGTEPDCPDGGECSLEHQICILGITGFVDDCGFVEIEDFVMKWQAAHDCALAAASEQRAFKLVADQFGFDSAQTDAYVAGDVCPYAVTKLHFDDDPCGGGGCGPVVFLSSCATLMAEPGCTVEPGNVCLRCGLPGESNQVCGPS